MASNIIPGVINKYNVYNEGYQLVGISGEVTLPDFEAMTETVSGAGILGEYEEVILGQFGSMSIEIPFRILDEDAFRIMSPSKVMNLTLRAAEQYSNKEDGEITAKGLRIVVRGRQKSIKTGKLQDGKPMDASVTLELLYIMIEWDGKEKIALDKLNNLYRVDGVDLIAKIKKLC